jgi:hypothetical protein
MIQLPKTGTFILLAGFLSCWLNDASFMLESSTLQGTSANNHQKTKALSLTTLEELNLANSYASELGNRSFLHPTPALSDTLIVAS